jgi:hypothetical protein
MGTSTKEAHQQVIAARKAFAGELDELNAATRSALDIPAKVRKHPLETAGLAGGAAFLAVGGPKRVLKAVGRRVRPTRKQRFKGVLPDELEKALDRLGTGAEDVRDRLEQDFYDWMSKRRSKEAPANARQSFWKTYDAFLGPLGALGAKALAQRFFAAPKDRPAGSTEPGAEAADVTMADLATAKAGEKVTEKLGGAGD